MATQVATGGTLSTSQWRVTAFNPIRSVEGLDYERCAALPNELLQIGWTGSGKILEYSPNQDQAEVLNGHNWFDFNGEAADEVRDRFSLSLISFLERALEVDNHPLFYYVGGLAPPDYMWSSHEDPYRYLTLYVANDISSQLEGLVFDQKENKAIIQMDTLDSFITMNGRQQWHPLEVVLSAWLDMVDVKKVEAVHPDIEAPNFRQGLWLFHPYSPQQLDETIDVFTSLVRAIESRMPGRPSDPSTEPLMRDSALDNAHIRSKFTRSFLGKARRPQFRYIAPGLELPSAEWFTEQPFIFLYLYFDLRIPSTPPPNPHGLDDRTGSHLPFPWLWSQLSTYPAGLYFTDSDWESSCFEDGVRLVLPFAIGRRNYARTSDGAKFGENKEDKGLIGRGRDTYADLYQLGWVPFVEFHEVRLAQVLKAWLKQVESGSWEVGPEGIIGGMDKWRDADTAEHWAEYVVPISW